MGCFKCSLKGIEVKATHTIVTGYMGFYAACGKCAQEHIDNPPPKPKEMNGEVFVTASRFAHSLKMNLDTQEIMESE